MEELCLVFRVVAEVVGSSLVKSVDGLADKQRDGMISFKTLTSEASTCRDFLVKNNSVES